MEAIDELIDKYVDFDQHDPEAGFIDDPEAWYGGCFEPADEPSADGFRMWYSKLTEQTGGQSDGAAQIDIKALHGPGVQRRLEIVQVEGGDES